MMRQTLITFASVVALAAPALAGAQDPRPRVSSRVVIEQERQRPQPRVLIQSRDGREEQRETFKKVVRLGGNGELDVINISGDITITRGGGTDATIDVTKIARARTTEEARDLLTLVKVEINERGNRSEVRTVYPSHEHMQNNRRNINVTVHYAITAPAGTRVTARSISGNLQATDITGELSLSTTSGNVQVTRARRVSAAKSTSGTVEVMETESDIAIAASTISGNVVFRQVRAPKMDLGTISGSVILQDVRVDRLEAESLRGNIEFSGPLTRSGRYDLTSHSGNVQIGFTGDTGFQIDANSWSGNVRSDVTLKDRQEGAADLRRRGNTGQSGRTRALRGTYGDGSATLDVTTFSGNVWIGKK